MTINILMPALSPTMEEGTLAKWLVKEGDIVQSGDIMAEIETDKATMEFEAVDEGTIGKILIPEGTENVTVNTAIAILLEDGENLSNLNEVSSTIATDKLEKTITSTENIISKDTIEHSTKISTKYIESELIPDGTTFTPTLVVGTTTILVYEVLGGCISDPTEIEIVVDEFPTISIPENLSVCRGDSILVTATNNGYDIIWSDGQTGESVWLKPDATASHTATATNPSCGSATDELLLTVNELPEIITSSDTVVGIGGEVKMWASSEDATLFTWSPAIYECITPNCSEVYAVPDRATVYVVTVTDDNGCMNTDTIFVDINGIMEVFVPNVFSPNGDGSNDYLVVHSPRLFEFKIEIYDRWGKKIYQTEEQKEYWDGTFNDKILPPQTFVYIITGITVLGEEVRKEGNTTIIK